MFYIETKPENGEVKRFVMDIETDVTLSMTGSPTSYTVEGGYSSSDHYHQPFDNISVTGLVSAVKFTISGKTSSDLVEFETGVRQLKQSGKLFRCSFSDNLEVYQNCLFTDLTFRRSVQNGPYCLAVSMRIQNIRKAQQAQLTAFPQANEDYKTIQSVKTTSMGGTVQADRDTLGDVAGNLLTGRL